jgi:peptide/nickel transport system substrate-binding protein
MNLITDDNEKPRRRNRMNRSTGQRRLLGAGSSRFVWVLLLAALAFAIVGCGGGKTSAGKTHSGFGVDGAGGKKGGTITVLSNSDVDYIDPGLAYYQFSYEVIYPVNRPLYSYKAGSSEVVPDLAESLPVVSADQKTFTIHLRKGVRFAPPVNREVTSADVKYAIERGFSQSVPNGYSSVYFGGIEGVPSESPKTPEPISGIQTPDKYTIVFKLTKPSGIFSGALALPLTAPVPQEYAKKFDSKQLSDYGFYQVASGPYMIRNDASGKINGVGYVPARKIELVRNPNWDASTDFRPAYADKVVFAEGFQDQTVMTRKILAGTGDANGDSPIPPAELKAIVANSTQSKQIFFTPVSGTRYVPLNTSKPPFDNEHVRRAVAYVLDRQAMRKTRGGPIDGDIATHFIDPSFTGKGFEDAGGASYDPFPSTEFTGDVAKAQEELKLAGFSDGMYNGPEVTMVADNTPPGSNTAKVVINSLGKIGMKVKLVSVTHPTMYTVYCNVPKKEPGICPNVGWLADFQEPQTLLNPTFNGKFILPVNNSNWPLQNDPALNKMMDDAEGILDAKARYKAWGEIDKALTEAAVAVPWIWEKFPTLFSSRVIPAVQAWNGGSPDVAFMSVK